MTGWLARVAATTALRGEEPRNRFGRWVARWRGPTPSVPESRFQHGGEAYPRHWRRFPDIWPITEGGDQRVVDELVAGIADLPTTWRDVVVARDVLGRDPAEVARDFGMSPREQRAILNRVRADLRERVARRLSPGARP
jgi:DNA-directed RNA polymerase specialized sigma24 family protein